MTDKTKREATCPTCGSDDRAITRLLCDDYRRRPDKWHDKPPEPEKAEWERLLNEHDCTLESNIKHLRAAVQRALDEREAATWRKAASKIFNYGSYSMRWIGKECEEGAAAAEARARKS